MIRRPHRLLVPSVLLIVALSLIACDTDNNYPAQPAVRALFTTPTGLVTANPPQVFVGAGDISSCSTNNDEATAKLLDSIPGTVYNLGDDAYDNGTTSEFNNCYGPTWGRHKARTYPAPGNHEYNSSGASPYFAYFGAVAGTPGQGWYSFNLGAWHIISLNSNISLSTGGTQDKWLQADLAAHPNQCILAYYHHPLYSSTDGTGSGGLTYSSSRMFVNDLYAAHADLILNGHRHFYERLAPMNPSGGYDSLQGVREIISGTGGIGGGDETNLFPLHEAGNGRTFGVLKLWLYDDSYAWKFVPIAGQTYTDSGSTPCHSAGSGGGSSGVSATNSTVSAAPTSFTAGSGSSTITVTAKDGNGNTISGASVTLSSTGTGNTLTPSSGTTNSSGVFTSTFTSTVAETKTLSATINGTAITQQASVTVNPTSSVSASNSTVGAAPTAFTAGGSSTVTITVKNGSGTAMSGIAVTLAASGSGNTITQPAATTNASGVTSGTFSSTGAGPHTITAVAGGVTLTQQPVVSVNAGPANAGQSTVTAQPSSIPQTTGTSTITVTVKDAYGNVVSGSTVVLAASGSGNTLTQPAGPTNASGVVTGTLSSSVAETKVVSATADGGAITQTATVTVTPPASSVVLVGAGNIGDCSGTNDEATAAILDTIAGTVFTTGDNMIGTGTLDVFNTCYQPSWGRHKARTRPAVGYQEYKTAGAAGYWQYFGPVVGDSGKYYYSYDVGSWHVIVLNDQYKYVPISAGSPQETWLKADLAATAQPCIMAIWSQPRFSSSQSAPRDVTLVAWNDLYAAGADLVVNGDFVNYERFAPQKPDGSADPVRGIRQFVVGTGGRVGFTSFVTTAANSEVRNNATYGVLQLALGNGSYSWQFIPVGGTGFADSGSGTCH